MPVIVAALSWSWRETEVDPLTGAVRANVRDRGPNSSELAALEHALRLAERWDARVVAATVAPAAADEMLRDALAAGATHALRVEPAGWMARPRPVGLVGGDQQSAVALAGALRQHYGVPDLVLCGDLAADRATGSFPAFLAASLGAAQALGCVRLEPADERALRVYRRLDGGRREVLTVRPPAVVSIEAAGVRLRRAGLPATLARQDAAITVAVTPAAAAARRIRLLGVHPYRPRPRPLPAPAGTALHRTLELTGALAQRTPPAVIGPLTPEAAADQLLAYLSGHGYLAAGGRTPDGPPPAALHQTGVTMVHQAADGDRHFTAPMLFGLHAVMLGRQGSGKGTQGLQLARLLVVPHISVGDVLRDAARSGTPAGQRAQETMERGELVADDLVVSLVAERLAAADVRSGGFVLDGFPRTVEQAEALEGMLADATLDRAVVIDVPIEVSRTRLLARRVCTGCGRIYSVERARGLETWTCGACGEVVRRRADDTEEAVTRRLRLYDEQTEPLLDWFARRDQLLMVDGVGTSEEVFERLLAGLWPRIPADRIAQLAGTSEPVPTAPVAQAAPDLSDGAIEVVIEVPRGSRNKYEFDHDRHVLHLDRRLFSATVYPADYGFVPDTLAEDGDPLDALVLLEDPVFPGCWVSARPIGIFWMEDEKGPDAKIICVPLGDPRWDQVRDLDDMPSHLRSEIHHFFDVYKALEPRKFTSTTGFEGRNAALGEIAASRARLLHQQAEEPAGQAVPEAAVPEAAVPEAAGSA